MNEFQKQALNQVIEAFASEREKRLSHENKELVEKVNTGRRIIDDQAIAIVTRDTEINDLALVNKQLRDKVEALEADLKERNHTIQRLEDDNDLLHSEGKDRIERLEHALAQAEHDAAHQHDRVEKLLAMNANFKHANDDMQDENDQLRDDMKDMQNSLLEMVNRSDKQKSELAKNRVKISQLREAIKNSKTRRIHAEQTAQNLGSKVVDQRNTLEYFLKYFKHNLMYGASVYPYEMGGFIRTLEKTLNRNK